MKAPLVHVASLLFNEPLAILPAKLEAILAAIGPRLAIDDAALDELVRMHAIQVRPVLAENASSLTQTMPSVTMSIVSGSATVAGGEIVVLPDAMAQTPGQNGQEEKPYRLTPEGVAVIPIRGTLMKRYSWMSMASGCTSYAGLERAAVMALEDPQVKAVLFDVDSPGGTTHGCFELSEALFNMRGDKPIWACANDLAASAAYALASAANRVLVTRTAGVGSIGVFALHADQSGLDAQTGVKYTYVFAGDKKTDGNPHEPLTKSARADIQAEVDREYAMFIAAVARNRNVDAAKVERTEAAVFFGDKAAAGPLADDVMSFDDALAELTAKVNPKPKPSSKVALETEPGDTDSQRSADMPAIAPHRTATSDKPWDGPRAKRNLREGADASYYRSAYAFAKPGGDPKTKAGYSFIHHMVSTGGDVGAANIKACQTSIGVLNGGRGGTVLKGSDRQGVYNHVAAHLRDAKLEPAKLASYHDYITAMLSWAEEHGDAHPAAMAAARLAELGEPEGETNMLRGSKKSAEAEDAEAVAAEKDDEKDDEEEDEEEDDKKKKDEEDEETESKKGESRKSRKGEGRKQDDEDEDDKGEGKRGSVTEMPRAANGAAKRIAELCQIAGAPELAADYIMRGYTVDRVIEKLSARRARASADNAVQAYVGGDETQMSVEQAIQQANTTAANSGGRLKPSQALEQMLHANPGIYEGYMNERDMVIAQSPGGRGPTLTGYVLGKQRRYMAALGLGTSIEDVPGRRQM